MSGPVRIGIDLGGTKIAGVAVDANGRVVAQERVATPCGGYHGSIEAIAEMVSRLRQQATGSVRAAEGLNGVGIGIPGSISPATGVIQNGDSVWLNGRPLHLDLERRMECPVRLANDADRLPLSEAHDSAGADMSTVFAVILGTGCGGGIVVDHRLVTGPHHTGSEWGHIPLPWAQADEHDGPQCWCGRRSCMETWVSGPA